MKFCKDCNHYQYFHMIGSACSELRCVRGERIHSYNLVSGRPLYQYDFVGNAAMERSSILPWHCGKKARYFEESPALGCSFEDNHE